MTGGQILNASCNQAGQNKLNVLLKRPRKKVEHGQLNTATKLYLEIKDQYPNNYEIYPELGVFFGMLGKEELACKMLIKSLSINPNDSQSWCNLGTYYRGKGCFKDASNAYDNATRINPRDSTIWINYSECKRLSGEYNIAVKYAIKSLRLSANSLAAYCTLGLCLQNKNRLLWARKCFDICLKIGGPDSDIFMNIGNLLEESLEPLQAIKFYKRALLLNPDNYDAQWNLGLTFLLLGQYQHGFSLYEKRHKITNPVMPHAIPRHSQRWHGEKLTSNELLLLVSEQGLGDIIQFARYLKILNEYNYNYVLCAPSNIVKVLTESGYNVTSIENLDTYDKPDTRWAPLMSLIHHLKINPVSHKFNHYLSVRKENIEKWSDILRPKAKPLIGISWQGNPDHEKTNLRNRSLNFIDFSQILSCEKLSWISLQKGVGSEQMNLNELSTTSASIQTLISNTWSFSETLAIMSMCDVVITNDSCNAHLAGSIGVKTWILLSSIPDWRWGLNLSSTHWYPSVRLFRQKKGDSWTPVMSDVWLCIQKELLKADN